MNTGTVYSSISQRAAASFQKALAKYEEDAALPAHDSLSRHDLNRFFSTFYDQLFHQPQAFGLPLNEDISVAEDDPNTKDKKQVVKQKLTKPRMMINQGLDYLMLAGIRGLAEGSTLIVEDHPALVKESGIKPKFLKGLESTGLVVSQQPARTMLYSPLYPEMMGALKCLAVACAGHVSAIMGKFNFARCDFRALSPNYEPDALDLYRVFTGDDYARLVQLHSFFNNKGYSTSLSAAGPSAWEVKYQGSRKIKATPLFQVGYEERYANPLRLSIKCASTNRIAQLLPLQSQFLQDDFVSRANNCNGDKCNWCRNQKTLGPSEVVYKGETKVLCWYSNPDIRGCDDSTVELVEQYATMHDQLLPERVN
jgi:hypothetical protein